MRSEGNTSTDAPARRSEILPPGVRDSYGRWVVVKPLNKNPRLFIVRENGNPSNPLRVLKKSRSQSAREIIKVETLALSMVEHPNIIKLIDADTESVDPYLVIEYHPVQNLRNVDLKFNWSDHQLMQLYHEAYHAIRYLHRKGITKNDLAPINILLDQRKPIFIDFEFAKITDDPTQLDKTNDYCQLGQLYHFIFNNRISNK